MVKRIINIDDVDFDNVTRGEIYAWSRKKITANLDSEKLGASMYEISPGKRAFMYHYHYANEELFYVL